MKNRAKLIRREVVKYLTAKGFSCQYEVGLNKWGKLRADVLAFNYKREMVVVEVKSGWADYSSDKKWKNYLDLSNKMYFAVDSEFPLKPEFLAELKEHGVGLLVVNITDDNKKYRSGSVRCKVNSKRRPMCGKAKRDIIVRIAYRQGMLRTNHRDWINKL